MDMKEAGHTAHARATKTEQYLTEALVSLVRTKPMSKIQVRELCQVAQVNRTTFYKHYESIANFIEHIVDSFLDKMDEHMKGANIFQSMFANEDDGVFLRCSSFMTQNIDFVNAFIGPNGSRLLHDKVIASWTQQFRAAVDSQMPSLRDRMSLDILTCYAISVMWGLLEFTVRDNVKYTAEYIGQQMRILIHDCTFKALLERNA